MKSNTVFNSGLYSLSTFDGKRIFLATYPSSLKNGNILIQTEVKHSFQQRVVFFDQISCQTHFLADILKIWPKVVFNTKLSQTQFSRASCIL